MESRQLVEQASSVEAASIRIVQLDVLRGFALLGIYWINVIVFGLPSGLYAVPNIIGETPQLNVIYWAFSELFIEGTMRGLFSILFGASAMLFLDEARLNSRGLEIVDRYYRRNMLLIVFGLLHAYLLLWPYDVLYAYGLIGMLLFPLRRLSARLLMIMGVVVLLLGEFDLREAVEGIGNEADMSSHEVLKLPRDDNFDPQLDLSEISTELKNTIYMMMYEDIELHQLGYLDLLRQNIDTVMLEQTVKMYTTHIFDIGGMMLIGMALFKFGLLSGQPRRRRFLLLMLSGYGLGFLVRGMAVYSEIRIGFNPEASLQNADIHYNIGRLPVTLGHIGLIGLLCKTRLFDSISLALAAVGRMALSNYVMQSVISIFIFYGVGLGWYGQFEHYQLIFICLSMWLWQISFSLFWFRYYKQGPLEWVWRSLIYGQRQPLLKA